MSRYFAFAGLGAGFGVLMAFASLNNFVWCGGGSGCSETVLAVASSPAIILLHPIAVLFVTPVFWCFAGLLLARAHVHDEFGSRRAGFIVAMLAHYAVALAGIFYFGWDLHRHLSSQVIGEVVIYVFVNAVMWLIYVRATRETWFRRGTGNDECHKCGYDMQGHRATAKPRCPECGTEA